MQRSLSFTRRATRQAPKAEEVEEPALTPRKVMKQLDAFSDMRKGGAGWGDALFSMLRGKRMTEQQAALYVQATYRRFQAATYLQEQRGAAITIQVCAA